MAYNVQPAIIGCAILPNVSDGRESLEELIYRVSQGAMKDAGLDIDDIDGIVVGANDQMDGRAISVMAASGSVGGVDRDILSTPSSAEHAFVLGALRIASGLFQTQLIVAWSPTEASPLREVERLAADPYFHRRLPLDELAAAGLQAGALEYQVAGARKAALGVAEKNRRNGAIAYPSSPQTGELGTVTRWPLREGMAGLPATGAVAMVLAGADEVARRGSPDPIWVRGMGWATEGSFLGDRDLGTVPSLAVAAQMAFREAGITNPATAFDLAEVADYTPFQELLAYEGLGLCTRGEWVERVAANAYGPAGSLPVNLSGGSLTCNPTYCTGLIRIAEIANQLRGRAGAHQRAGARRGVAHAASGFAMQYNTVIVLDRNNTGRRRMKAPRVGIIGIGQSAFRAKRDDASYPDLVREAVRPAMADCGLDFDQIDAVVYSLSPDAMVGIGNAERTGVDAVGARNKRFLRINTGGATGISSVAAAYYHIASGVCDTVLTAGADKVASAATARRC